MDGFGGLRNCYINPPPFRYEIPGPAPGLARGRGGVFLINDLSAAQPTVEFDSDEFNTKEINGVDSIIHHF